jgi:hypothetical protein
VSRAMFPSYDGCIGLRAGTTWNETVRQLCDQWNDPKSHELPPPDVDPETRAKFKPGDAFVVGLLTDTALAWYPDNDRWEQVKPTPASFEPLDAGRVLAGAYRHVIPPAWELGSPEANAQAATQQAA